MTVHHNSAPASRDEHHDSSPTVAQCLATRLRHPRRAPGRPDRLESEVLNLIARSYQTQPPRRRYAGAERVPCGGRALRGEMFTATLRRHP
jgi:hypothetical protein